MRDGGIHWHFGNMDCGVTIAKLASDLMKILPSDFIVSPDTALAVWSCDTV